MNLTSEQKDELKRHQHGALHKLADDHGDQHFSWATRIEVTEKHNLPHDVQMKLAGEDNEYLHHLLATNPHTKSEVLAKIFEQHKDYYHGNSTHHRLAKHPNSPEHVIDFYVNHHDHILNSHAAENPSLKPHHIEKLVAKNSTDVDRQLIGNRNVPYDVASELYAKHSSDWSSIMMWNRRHRGRE